MLFEKEARLARVIDARTSQNLLREPRPLEVMLPDPKPESFTPITLHVENGWEDAIDLTISADQPWVEVQTSQLGFLGGEKAECKLVVHGHRKGPREFANLCFAWKGNNSDTVITEYVLIWRRSPGVWTNKLAFDL